MKTIRLIIVIAMVGVFAVGCPKKQPGGKAPADAEQQQAQQGQPPAQQAKPEPQPRMNPDGTTAYATVPISDKDFGAITGRIILNAKGGERGNLFVYIPDASSVNDSAPRALASQIITADQISGGVVSYQLNHVPAGDYSIFAIWDIAEPHCDPSVPACSIAEDTDKDRFAQSDPITVSPGTMTKGVDIALNLTTP